MIRELARRRMNAIEIDIQRLVHKKEVLTDQQQVRLERLDRDYAFWKSWAG